MPRVPLLSGAYTARGLMANAQRCINLYPEFAQEAAAQVPGAQQGSAQAPTPVAHYQAPGSVLLREASGASGWRGLYTASNGKLFGVCEQNVYYVDSSFTCNYLGTIKAPVAGAPPLVSMTDNGIDVLLVDGSPEGYSINIVGTPVMTTLSPEANGDELGYGFVGFSMVDYLDTFTIGALPGSKQFGSSLSNTLIFEPLQVAAKTGYPDPLAGLVVCRRAIWLVGSDTTEIWFNAGGVTFPFAIQPGAYVEHGCIAPSTIFKVGEDVMWLSQDKRGRVVAVRSQGYDVIKASTHAIENEWMTYPDLAGATGWTYQQEGHTFWVINFPAADRTWAYDLMTRQWHERAWMDSEGKLHRHRGNCGAYAYGRVIVGDWENGNLYELDLDVHTDDGEPMHFLRSFPHLLNNADRVIYPGLIADMQVGEPDLSPTNVAGEYCSFAVVETQPVSMATSSALVGTPAAFYTALFSCHVLLIEDGDPHGLWFSNQTDDSSPGTGGVQIGLFNTESSPAGEQIIVRGYSAGLAPVFEATYGYSSWSGWVWIAISLNTATQTIQCWVNNGVDGDEELTPSGETWFSSLPIGNTPGQPWHLIPGEV